MVAFSFYVKSLLIFDFLQKNTLSFRTTKTLTRALIMKETTENPYVNSSIWELATIINGNSAQLSAFFNFKGQRDTLEISKSVLVALL